MTKLTSMLWFRQPEYSSVLSLPRITAADTATAMIRLLAPRRGAVQTITLDNGSELTAHGV